MSDKPTDIGLMTSATFVIWVALIAIGLWQFLMTTGTPPPASLPEQVVMAIDVRLGDPSPRAAANAIASPQADVVSDVKEIPVPAGPALMAIAPAPKMLHRSTAPQRAAEPVYQQITYGVGEGAQPEPEYPLQAQQEGQTGTVVVQFEIDTEGHIKDAAIQTPSRWPMLNAAALRGVRDTWNFPAGPVRHRFVKIVYQSKADQ